MKTVYRLLPLLAWLLASCGSQKTVVQQNAPQDVIQQATQPMEQRKLAFVRKVNDNAVYVDNITSKIDFTLNTGGKDISVSGKLMMRRDDVIRIQLQVPLLGMEAGRLEFTKDYVMIVDRIHSEYIKGDYTQIDFLKNNGLNFNSLQALFWNQLFVPGKEQVAEGDLTSFDAVLEGTGDTTPVILKNKNMTYQWLTNTQTALIEQVEVGYTSKQSGSTSVSCLYDDFKPLGLKMFPTNITLDMQTSATQKARRLKMAIKMKGLSTDSNWESRTTLSKKYKEVSVEEVLKKLTSL